MRQVWNSSKISAHEEIAHGTVPLPARELQGDKTWEQRLHLTPAPPACRAGKTVWGGEVMLKLQFTEVYSNELCMGPSSAVSYIHIDCRFYFLKHFCVCLAMLAA